MTVHWQQPAEQNGFIRKYRLVLTYTIDGRQSTITTETNNQIFNHSLDVFGGIQYSVEIWAETVRLGPSLTGTKEVPEYKPSTSPHNITSKKMNETTYRISWNPLPRNTSNGKVIAYEVKQTKLSTSRTARSVSTPAVLQNTSDTFIVLTGLLSCSIYKVEVRAYTSAGPGVFGSMAHDIATSAPGEPTNLHTENPSQRSITLLWDKPDRHGDDVKRYKIYCKSN
ncbi:contactin-3-like [Porites lutea]|uniref:contactin-3-like n=1 Tax=Porites lutea TaxID=51062 RepID=UPI003CC5B7CF